MAYTLIYSPV